MTGQLSLPEESFQPVMGRGMFMAMDAGDAPSSSAGAYTLSGLMEEPTGIFMSVARLSVFLAVGTVRLPTIALISPVW